MSEKTAPPGLEVDTDLLIRKNHILWRDKDRNPFAYTIIGGMGVPPGRAASIIVHSTDYVQVLNMLSRHEIVF
jgi:hypothetical protein